MTSLAMWFNCLRGLSEEGPLTVSALVRRVRMGTNLDGMRRWGYITIDGVGRVRRGEQRPRAKAGSVVALTERGREAADVWRPLAGEIEQRWCERFGVAAIDRLRAALIEIADRTGLTLPDFMPIGSVYGVGMEEPSQQRDPGRRDADPAGLPLISLLSRALLTFALDYERGARLSLCVQCNGLRVLTADGVPLRQLPMDTGVAKEGVSMIVNQLQRVGCVGLVPLPGAARGKLARLSADRGPPGQGGWVSTAGADARRLARALWRWRGHSTARGARANRRPRHRGGSPLFAGLDPYPDGWRALAPKWSGSVVPDGDSPRRLPRRQRPAGRSRHPRGHRSAGPARAVSFSLAYTGTAGRNRRAAARLVAPRRQRLTDCLPEYGSTTLTDRDREHVHCYLTGRDSLADVG